MVRRLLPLLLVGALAAPAAALVPDRALTQYLRRSFGTTEGLPHSSPVALLAARNGYLWIGTDEGLARFDGVRFTLFDARHGLGDPMILALAETRDGTVWAGSKSAGLHRLAPGATTFTRVPLGGDPARTAWIAALSARGDDLWVGTFGGGAWRIAGHGGATRGFTTADGLASDLIQTLLEDDAGDVWLGGRGGLDQIHQDHVQRHGTDEGRNVLSLAIARGGGLWVGGRGRVARFQSGRLTPLAGGPPFTATAVREDSDGNLWIGTLGGGLYRHTDGRFARMNKSEGLLSDFVRALVVDREGSLWVGCEQGGLVQLRDASFVPYGAAEGFTDEQVFSLLEDRAHALWFATSGAGLHRFAGGKWTSFHKKDGLLDEMVVSLLEDRRDGTLWIGTYTGGLFHLRGERFEHVDLPDKTPGAIDTIFQQDDGALWVGTLGRGLFILHFDGPEGSVRAESLISTDAVKNGVTVIAGTRDGTTWAATYGRGLRAYRGAAVTTEMTTQQGLASDTVVALHPDADGETLWIGTIRGLSRWRGGRLTTYTSRNGLCDDMAGLILDDGKGSLWIGSNHGMGRVRRADLEAVAEGRSATIACTPLGAADGMRSLEVSGGATPAGVRAHDGVLWIPTARGALRLDPARVLTSDVAPAVHVESVVADGRHVDDTGEVAPGRGELEVRYTATSFVAPERVRFKYQLEGYDRGWVDAGPRRVAYYTNLPPGRYRFHVIAANSDGVWNETGATRALRLAPRFYQTVWFLLLCGLAAVAVVIAGYRARVSQLRGRQRELGEQVRQRTADLEQANRDLLRAQAQLVQSEKMSALGQLVAGVAHELNNPVNFITGNIDFLEERHRLVMELVAVLEAQITTDEGRSAVARAKQAADFGYIVDDAPELLRAFRNGAERIAAVVDSLRRFAGGEGELAPTRLAEEVRTTIRLLQPMLRDEVRVHVDLDALPPVVCRSGQINQVVMNLVVNGAQAIAGPGDIHIGGRVDGDFVEIDFRDSGPGVPPHLREKIFEPFFTTKEVGRGIGLGLSISFGIVAAHGGSLVVAPTAATDGNGATFRLRLPIRGPRA